MRLVGLALLTVLALTAACDNAPGSTTPPTSSESSTTGATFDTIPPATFAAISPPTSQAPASAVPPSTTAPEPTGVDPLTGLLVIEEPDRVGYDRGLFGGFVDVDHDGCDTPCEVYLAQRLPDGTWRSPYDGFVSATPQDFQVDHVVALAEAWDSGAAAWPADLRAAIYNDQIDQLLVVSSSSNGSKSDGDPADWRPPDPAAWCDFAQRWVAVKVRYQLSADPAEVGALHQLLGTCTAA